MWLAIAMATAGIPATAMTIVRHGAFASMTTAGDGAVTAIAGASMKAAAIGAATMSGSLSKGCQSPEKRVSRKKAVLRGRLFLFYLKRASIAQCAVRVCFF